MTLEINAAYLAAGIVFAFSLYISWLAARSAAFDQRDAEEDTANTVRAAGASAAAEIDAALGLECLPPIRLEITSARKLRSLAHEYQDSMPVQAYVRKILLDHITNSYQQRSKRR